MRYQLIVFDLDGTLLNTLPDLNNATNYALSLYHYDTISLEETRSFIGSGIKNLIIKSMKGNSDHFEEVFMAFKDYYYKNCVHATIPYENIDLVLRKIKEDNCLLAVFTNKAQNQADKIIQYYFPNTFDIVFGQKEGVAIKPNPEGLFSIVRELNVSLSNTLYIGDSDVDVKTAKAAKCDSIIVSYGYRSKKDLMASGAENMVDSPMKLVEWLKSQA